MPELPEVEATVRRLRPFVENQKISHVSVFWERSVVCVNINDFKNNLQGQKILALERRGKYLMFKLESGYVFLHLRMSGKIAHFGDEHQIGKHTRIVFELEGNGKLCFDDVRKFGKCYYVLNPEDIVGALGVEPLSPDFSLNFLKNAFNRSTKIKTLLLDQSVIVGIGNIYADESLWHAKIHPSRKASSLSEKEIQTLRSSLQAILQQAIVLGGTDFGDNVVVGDFSPLIYGQIGKLCPRCQTPIEKITVAQRGTHFCPSCQLFNEC